MRFGFFRQRMIIQRTFHQKISGTRILRVNSRAGRPCHVPSNKIATTSGTRILRVIHRVAMK
jgi:hypothetical protein